MICFRAHVRAAPLKRGLRKITMRQIERFPRARARGSIEAELRQFSVNLRPKCFRAHVRAAPLKPQSLTSLGHTLEEFPRARARGSIEA